jgi:hypothetical protein
MIHQQTVRRTIVILAAVALTASSASAALLFDKAEYAARRARLMEKIPDGVAVILGAQPLASYCDYHQNNDVFYLSGVEVPNAVLIIDGLRKDAALLFTATGRSLRNEGLGTDILKNPQEVRPGLTLEECRKEVTEILQKKGYDLSRDYFQRIRPGFGHCVGLAVHDVGGGPMTLKPGMVFANEPMIIYPKKNLGVRVEDTVLITDAGCEILTAGIAREVKDIEDLMRKDGIPQVLKKAGLD